MKFLEIYNRYRRGLTSEEAAALLGVSVSTFYRMRQRYGEEDFDGIFDRRIGKPSPHRAADHEVRFITKLYADQYKDFSVRHFYEFSKQNPNFNRSYNWTKNKLVESGLIEKSSRGGKHRLRRERKPMAGMMLHQDGSKHRWIPFLDYDLDLIVTLDDATSMITSCFLVEEEGTSSSFQGIYDTIVNFGLFCTLYTDRGSHYFYTPKEGGKVDINQLTQVGRALCQLGIKHIAAYSPQARGRSERMFGTLQNRLPKELALHNITTIEAANRYIREIYLPRHNKQFSVKPKSAESAFIQWKSTTALENILCIENNRKVQRDNTVHYNGLILQIPKNEYRSHYINADVKICEYFDRSLAIFYGHLCVAKYDADGNLKNSIKKAEVKNEDKKISTEKRNDLIISYMLMNLWTSPSDQPVPCGPCG